MGLAIHEQLARELPPETCEDASAALAAVIALDQFPRNIFRGTPRAFATDPIALGLAKHAVAQGFYRSMSKNERLFLYLPFQSARKWRVMANLRAALGGREGRRDEGRRRGCPARRPGTCSASSRVSTRGGARRTVPVGGGSVEDETARLRGRHDGGGLRHRDGQADQETDAACVGHSRVAGQSLAQVRAEYGGVLEEAVLLDGLDDRQTCRARHRVAAEGRPVIAGLEEVPGRAEADDGADGDAAAEALRDRDEVGRRLRPVGEPLPGASQAGLDLVEPQQSTGSVAMARAASR